MNSSHGSCSFPRVNYLSLLSLNESAVPVIKQLHSISAPVSSSHVHTWTHTNRHYFKSVGYSDQRLFKISIIPEMWGLWSISLPLSGHWRAISDWCILICAADFYAYGRQWSQCTSHIHWFRTIIPVCQGLIVNGFRCTNGTHKGAHMLTYVHMQTLAYAHTPPTHAESSSKHRCSVINSEQSVCSLSSAAQDVGGVLSEFCHCMVKSLGHLDYKL